MQSIGRNSTPLIALMKLQFAQLGVLKSGAASAKNVSPWCNSSCFWTRQFAPKAVSPKNFQVASFCATYLIAC